MQIREATPDDVLKIVEVLKASLGETNLPLSEVIWNFKHVKNPFGKSIVLIATEGDDVIGVRAFMRWQWHNGKRTYSCFRAVDTATHPEHQGKGVFKKLTLEAVELAKAEGADFIFNTPNEKSRPGYLKMGWKIGGKLQVGLSPAIFSFWKFKKDFQKYEIDYQTSLKDLDALCNEWNFVLKKDKLYTKKSVKYLNWRYEINPLQSYEVLATSDFYLAAYIKKRKGIKELRIAECIKIGNRANTAINRSIKRWASNFGVQFISFSPLVAHPELPSLKGNFGPVATIRNLNLTGMEKDLCFEIDNWVYSLGDLELF